MGVSDGRIPGLSESQRSQALKKLYLELITVFLQNARERTPPGLTDWVIIHLVATSFPGGNRVLRHEPVRCLNGLPGQHHKSSKPSAGSARPCWR